ncbi:MAG: ATP-binding cassette domain-containing protein [Actinobacteria bacterium]|nr:ATP-binding cassette domain-containing protein [Actinomycetota bacterium]
MIRLEHLTKRFPGGQVAVDDLSLDVDDGELCVLVGPSGCGKTTILKMVNRLVEPTSGRIVLDGDDVTSGDPVALRRRIGYVIQHVGLFPHQTIAANVATVPRLLGWERARVAERVAELLALVGLDPAVHGPRYPHQLSGGQRQRVGVARALAADPPVLLMDEPFGAIDPISRDRLQREFLLLQGTLRKTVIFVTHDVEEAVRLGDRIAVLAQGGVLAQHATPSDVLGHPADDFVADFVGADRGLKRLRVTPVGAAVDQPVVVSADTSLDEAGRAMDAAGTDYAVVLGAGRRLEGWLGREPAGGVTAGDAATPVDAPVPSSATLQDALSALLLRDAGWVAVADGERFVGVVTPESLHRASRAGQATTGATASSVSPAAT